MAGIDSDNILDMIAVTLDNLGKGSMTFEALDLQEYLALPKLMKNNKVTLGGGSGIKWTLMKKHSGAARPVSLFAVDNVNQGDVLKRLRVDWRHITTDYSYEDREFEMNMGEHEILDLIKVRRLDGLTSLAELAEDFFWGVPLVTDTQTPYGIGYYVVKASGTPSFQGNLPSGYSAVADLVPSSLEVPARWKNWAGAYTATSQADLGEKLVEAKDKVGFMNPNPDIIPGNSGPDKFAYYCNWTVKRALEKNARDQNDQVGPDVYGYHNKTLLGGIPIVWAPRLDDTASGQPGYGSPVYGLNWPTFDYVFLRGEYMNEMGPKKAPLQHRTNIVHVDNSCNLKCSKRRSNFVLSTAA